MNTPLIRPILAPTAALAALLVLAGCGGGGGNASTSDTNYHEAGGSGRSAP